MDNFAAVPETPLAPVKQAAHRRVWQSSEERPRDKDTDPLSPSDHGEAGAVNAEDLNEQALCWLEEKGNVHRRETACCHRAVQAGSPNGPSRVGPVKAAADNRCDRLRAMPVDMTIPGRWRPLTPPGTG